jgi:hypothetical protein
MSHYLTHHLARALVDERVSRDQRHASSHALRRRVEVRTVRPAAPRPSADGPLS